MASKGVDTAVVALVALLCAGGAHAKTPDKTGTHKYAGEVCRWASYESGVYIEMEFREFTGRVEPAESTSVNANPFNWRMLHPDGETTTSGNASTAKGALNGLCGHMIDAQERLEQSRSYDRHEAFQALVDVLDGGSGN